MLLMSARSSQAYGREQFLPKPTCFPEVRRRRDARAETSISRGWMLLDHLFRRNNTSVHVVERLILVLSLQTLRLPTSNLSWRPSEVERTTQTYSDSYGDLGTTVVAILLHPEARSSGVNAKYGDTLREHMVRVIHSMGHELQERTQRSHRVLTITGCH